MTAAVSVRPARAGERSRWDDLALRRAGGNLLQTWAWADLKAEQGWGVDRLLAVDGAGEPAGCMHVLTRSGPLGVGFAYAPRGPAVAGDPREAAPVVRALVAAAAAVARRRRCLVFKLDPEWPEADPATTVLCRAAGMRPSRYDVQHRKTYLVDLTGGAGPVLARLKASTRHHIRRAERDGVTVDELHGGAAAAAVDRFHPLYLESAVRGGFNPRDAAYHRATVRRLAESCPVGVLVASVGGEDVAGMVAVAAGPRLCYLYGGSSPRHARHHPNYLVHWRAVEWGTSLGCEVYDMWGVPNHEDPSAPGAGYYEFKTRWNGRVERHIRCQEVPLWPPLGPLPSLGERLALRGRPLLT